MKKSWFGFAIRIAAAGLFAVMGTRLGGISGIELFGGLMPRFAPFGAFAYTFLLTVLLLPLSMKRDPDRDWSKPSWFSNPFNGLEHQNHMGGWCFIICGSTGVARVLIFGHPATISLFFLAFGLGLILGIEAVYKYFAPRILNNRRDAF